MMIVVQISFVCLLLSFASVWTSEVVPGKKAPYCVDKQHQQQHPTAWKCDQTNATSNKCIRVRVEDEMETSCLTSLNVCNVICFPHASLWPLPIKKVSVGKDLIAINADKVDFVNISTTTNTNLLNKLKALRDYFKNVINDGLSTREDAGASLKIIIMLQDEDTTSFTYNTSEKHHLLLSRIKDNEADVEIKADNYFGARHAIETLLQLIVLDEISNSLYLPTTFHIDDAPAYRHRGLMLDTSRNYYPVEAIKRLLDGMAQNKLNVFHWHLTDSQSFPFESKHYPRMALDGAYSPKKIYSRSNIVDIVEYASVRGIKVIPELDVPAHVGEGWRYFEEDVLLCFNDAFCGQPPCGILNPINERVYKILRHLYTEFNELFDTDVFHTGGDEIVFECWNKTASILKWFSDRNWTRTNENFLQLWAKFHKRSIEEFDASVKNGSTSKKIILWTSDLTESESVTQFFDPSRFIIQIWGEGSNQIVKLLEKGYNIIVSNSDALYFDCGFGATLNEGNNWCSPYHSWQKVYINDVKSRVGNLTGVDYDSQILGGEAALWSELSDGGTLDSRMWPRATALAERLWTNPSTKWQEAEGRIFRQRERMAARSVAPDLIGPLWCHHNTGMCLI